MSAITHGIRIAKYGIPENIINDAFKQCVGYRHTSIDEMIRLHVVLGRVFKDIDLVGGETVYLPVVDGTIIMNNYNMSSIFYSDEYLQGREIISPIMYHESLALQHNNNSVAGDAALSGYQNTIPERCCPSNYPGAGGEAINNQVDRLSSSVSPVVPITNTQLTLSAKNTIVMRYGSLFNNVGVFEVEVSNDPYLNNISPRSYPAFGKLVSLALKSYIYTKLYIELGRAALHNGQELQQRNSFVDKLASAEEEYLNYLTTDWAEIAFINDTTKYEEYIQLQIDPNF